MASAVFRLKREQPFQAAGADAAATRGLRTFAHFRRPTCSLAQRMPRRERCFCARPRKLVSRLVGGRRLCAMFFCEASSPAPLRVFIVPGKGDGADEKICALSLFACILVSGIFAASPSRAIALKPPGCHAVDGAPLRTRDHLRFPVGYGAACGPLSGLLLPCIPIITRFGCHPLAIAIIFPGHRVVEGALS